MPRKRAKPVTNDAAVVAAVTSPETLGNVVLERVLVADLLPADYNPRTMTAAARAGLSASIETFGLVQPIVRNRRTGRVVGGHRRLEELAARGVAATDVVVVDLDETKERALNLALNNPGLCGQFTADLDRLLRELEEPLGDVFGRLRMDGLSNLIETLAEPVAPMIQQHEAPDLDAIPEPPPPVARAGDVWKLGDHVIACGDNADAALVAAVLGAPGKADLFLTDPPYAIYGSSTGIAADIADDRMIRDFFVRVLRLADAALPWLAHAYVFCDWRSYAAWWESARGTQLRVKNALVWDKGNFGLGANYSNTYELVVFMHRVPPGGHTGGAGKRAGKAVNATNILRFPRPRDSDRLHNAAKPVDLLVQLVENSSDAGALVFDPFLGSGSTLIACERTGRRCAGLDVEPKWIDVTVARWERLTGRKAERVTAGG